ncbi:MAG: gliding motility-associated C-terminal domain-containing protein [Saprospirales bacterium]|nr:gliding motility-associated C-terminal domain-containing protein [Saprospirales bacterium]
MLLVDLSFELPNAFTPDGDGANDTFRPLFNGEVFQDFQLLIFDRWGEKVYQSKDPGTGWNGQLDGKPMPSDVFAFFMEYTLMDGTEGTEKGEITLLR